MECMANTPISTTPLPMPVVTSDPEVARRQLELLDLQIEEIREWKKAKQDKETREKAARRQFADDAKRQLDEVKASQAACSHRNTKGKGGILNVVAVHRQADGTCLVLCPYCRKTGAGPEAEMRREFKGVWPEEDAIGFTVVGGSLARLLQGTTGNQW